MPKTKERNNNAAESSTTEKDIRMILALNPHAHGWVKAIADATGLTHPNVVRLILDEATTKPTDEYITRIEKTNATKALKELDEKEKALKQERQRLTELLK